MAKRKFDTSLDVGANGAGKKAPRKKQSGMRSTAQQAAALYLKPRRK
jgi:hypothetical protein